MIAISEATFEFLKEQYKQAVANLLDDPEGWVDGEVSKLPEEVQKLAAIGHDIGIPFREATTPTEFEMERLTRFLHGRNS